MPPTRHPQPVFYYDLGSPCCYLVAEQITAALGVVPEWEPVLGAQIGALEPELDRRSIEEQVAGLGLQPLNWPARWPPETRTVMLAATYAKRVGRAVAFSLAAFRQAFAAGRDLAEIDTVLIAAAACEMHPTAVLRGVSLRSVESALERAAARARSAGVSTLPAIEVAERVFQGQDAPLQAAETLGAAR